MNTHGKTMDANHERIELQQEDAPELDNLPQAEKSEPDNQLQQEDVSEHDNELQQEDAPEPDNPLQTEETEQENDPGSSYEGLLFPYPLGDESGWGYIDSKGNTVIEGN